MVENEEVYLAREEERMAMYKDIQRVQLLSVTVWRRCRFRLE